MPFAFEVSAGVGLPSLSVAAMGLICVDKRSVSGNRTGSSSRKPMRGMSRIPGEIRRQGPRITRDDHRAEVMSGCLWS